jgi:hypothetical protein
VGSGNPCNEEDMNIFYAATKITIGNGGKTPFWHAPLLHGRAPKDIAPKFFESSSRKKWMTFHGDTWIGKVNLEATFTLEHIAQFVELWSITNNVNFEEDDIVWKFMKNGQYSAASAYELQFHGLVYSEMDTIVWKAWAPPKVKHHAWIALQNRLQKRGWPNCGLCSLCKQVTETTNHLFVSCRFTIRIWELLKDWLGLQGFHPRQWEGLNIKEWWSSLADGATPRRKALASVTLLLVWEI